MKLPDGTIVPSYLNARRTLRPQPSGQFGNIMLRLGEVKEIVYPDDARNVSKKVVEYRVAVQQRDRGVGVTTDYTHCVVSNLFGGLGDKLRYTVRSSTEKDIDPQTGLGDGAIVLLLCINGETNNAVIIGGFQSQDDAVESEEDGHHLHFNFNGIDVAINKDGEFSFEFDGATKNDGNLTDEADANASGTKITITKDGTLTIADGGIQTMVIDRPNKTISLTADSEYDVTCQNGHVVIKSTGVLVGDATDAWVKGTTYRKAETIMNRKLSAQMAILNATLATAASALQTAASLMSMSPAGNIPAAGPVATAAGMLRTAASATLSAKSAFDSFEEQASKYLSTKNLTD